MSSPKAKALSNHEIVTMAVYLLGGDTLRIETEARNSLRLLFDLKAKDVIAELGQVSVEEADEVEEKVLQS